MADGSQVGLPPSNRGVSQFRNWTGIDWCAFAICVDSFFEVAGYSIERGELINNLHLEPHAADFAAMVHCFLFAGTGIVLSDEHRNGRFYASRFALQDGEGKHCGLIEFGGEHTRRKDGAATARVELTGEGCALFEGRAACSDHAKRWLELRAKLESCNARLTRLDVAFDDFDGMHTVSDAIAMHADGAFVRRGQVVELQEINDHGSNKGCTAYIGSNSSEQRLRVYEKGKQLGDRLGVWVRWEVQFMASSRKELSLDMLRDPQSFFRGAYPMLDFIDGCLARLESTGEKSVACFKSVMRHVRRQYGKTFNFLQHYLRDDEAISRFVGTLSRPGLPEWGAQYLEVQKQDPERVLCSIGE